MLDLPQLPTYHAEHTDTLLGGYGGHRHVHTMRALYWFQYSTVSDNVSLNPSHSHLQSLSLAVILFLRQPIECGNGIPAMVLPDGNPLQNAHCNLGKLPW